MDPQRNPLNDRQLQVLALLKARDCYGATRTQVLANHVHCDTLSLSSTLRALQRRELAGDLPPKDQWDSRSWFITKQGEHTLKEKTYGESQSRGRSAPEYRADDQETDRASDRVSRRRSHGA